MVSLTITIDMHLCHWRDSNPNPSKRTAADPLIPRSHRDRLAFELRNRISWVYTTDYWRKTYTVSFLPPLLTHFKLCVKIGGFFTHFNGVVETGRPVWFVQPRNRVSIPGGERRFFCPPAASVPVLGSTRLPIHWRRKVLYPRLMRTGRVANLVPRYIRDATSFHSFFVFWTPFTLYLLYPFYLKVLPVRTFAWRMFQHFVLKIPNFEAGPDFF